MQPDQKDEIDMWSLLTIMWNGKWIIITTTIVAFIVSAFYKSTIPNLYEISSNLSNDDQNVFIKYKSLNDALKQKNDPFIKEHFPYFDNESFIINGNLIVDMFTKEFRDYEEMISILSKNEFVINKIKDLNDFQKRKALVNFANKFKIVKNGDPLSFKIVFNWHDVDEGIMIANKALKLTLTSVREKLYMDVTSLASSLDIQNKRKITSLKNKLDITREIYKLSIAKKKLHLTEQSKIAKELGIENHHNFLYITETQTKNFLPRKPLPSGVLESQDYLRGFKALDKEIQIIKERSIRDKDLMADGYIKIKNHLLLVENDNRSNALRDAANVILNDDINNWIKFNLEFATIKNLKKSTLFIFLSTIVGIIIGIFGVLLASGIKYLKKMK